MMDYMTIRDIAIYLQKRLGRYHLLEEIITILEGSLPRFKSVDSLWDYIVEYENGLYLDCEDGIDIIL